MSNLFYALALDTKNILTLAAAEATEITCKSGFLWVTEENLQHDIILRPGQSYMIQTAGKVILSGLPHAELNITPVGMHLNLTATEKHTLASRLQPLLQAIEQTNLLNKGV